jgi:hypothetical protein
MYQKKQSTVLVASQKDQKQKVRLSVPNCYENLHSMGCFFLIPIFTAFLLPCFLGLFGPGVPGCQESARAARSLWIKKKSTWALGPLGLLWVLEFPHGLHGLPQAPPGPPKLPGFHAAPCQIKMYIAEDQ